MSKVWILVADDMSAASVAGIAEKSGCSVDALVFGDASRAEAVAGLGVGSVSLYETEETLAESMASAIAQCAVKELPAAVVLSDNATARAIAGAVAVELNAAVATNVTSVKVEAGKTVVEQLAAEGEAVRVLEATGPVVCVIADGGEEAEQGAPVAVETVSAEQAHDMKVVATNVDAGGSNGLTTAEKVVGVGLGIGEKENLSLVDDLADALGAEVACTLPLCDNYHWFEHNRVVGTSTQKIPPRLYMCFGSSGAPQHMTGVRSSKVIVAVNNDPEAPVFRECAYGIVGDAKKILPVLTEAVRKA